MVGSLKAIVRRQRPAHNQEDMFGTISVDRFSFPSGHATRATTVACFIVVHFLSGTYLVYPLILWAVLVIASRVLLGRHYVSDVFVGVIIGVVQYIFAAQNLWLSSDMCEYIIRPIQEELHL